MVDGVYDLSQADQRKAAAEKALLAASRMAQEAPDIRYSVRGDEADEYLDNKSVAAVVKCFMELFLSSKCRKPDFILEISNILFNVNLIL